MQKVSCKGHPSTIFPLVHWALKIESYHKNNFNSDGAKMWCFLPTTHVLTPHKKRKKYKKKKILHPPARDPRCRRRDFTMEQERKEKEEKRRRKKEGSRRPWVCETLRWVSPEGSPLGLAGRGSTRPMVFFFLPVI
jgi:hypothetical protein